MARLARCRGYLAGLQSWVSPRTRQTLLGGEPFGSFEHSYDALGGVDNADLLAFEADLKVSARLGVSVRVAELERRRSRRRARVAQQYGAADGAEQHSPRRRPAAPLGAAGLCRRRSRPLLLPSMLLGGQALSRIRACSCSAAAGARYRRCFADALGRP